jgi:excisionase family DNA binding protein
VTIPTRPSSADLPVLQMFDVEAVATILNCSERHVYRLVDAGKMPAPVRLGALVRWNRQAIEDWMTSGCRPVRDAGRARP